MPILSKDSPHDGLAVKTAVEKLSPPSDIRNGYPEVVDLLSFAWTGWRFPLRRRTDASGFRMS